MNFKAKIVVSEFRVEIGGGKIVNRVLSVINNFIYFVEKASLLQVNLRTGILIFEVKVVVIVGSTMERGSNRGDF